jgi:hypothetical protein
MVLLFVGGWWNGPQMREIRFFHLLNPNAAA